MHKKLSLIVLVMGLAACSGEPPPTAEAPEAEKDGAASLLVFLVNESGHETYFSRVLITSRHVRMDEGDDAGAYTLFDRGEGIYYNVDPEEKSVVVISPPPLEAKDVAESPELVKAPMQVEGIESDSNGAAEGWKLLADGNACAETIVLSATMPEATAALVEFHTGLAGHHAATLTLMTDVQRDPCALADDIFAPGWPYELGLPLMFQSERMRRELVDRDSAYQASADLFLVPEGFRRIEIPVPRR